MKVKFKNTMLFRGAVTNNRLQFPAGIPVTIDEKEIAHIDPKDYVVVEGGSALDSTGDTPLVSAEGDEVTEPSKRGKKK
jgi:hypothetical protein